MIDACFEMSIQDHAELQSTSLPQHSAHFELRLMLSPTQIPYPLPRAVSRDGEGEGMGANECQHRDIGGGGGGGGGGGDPARPAAAANQRDRAASVAAEGRPVPPLPRPAAHRSPAAFQCHRQVTRPPPPPPPPTNSPLCAAHAQRVVVFQERPVEVRRQGKKGAAQTRENLCVHYEETGGYCEWRVILKESLLCSLKSDTRQI